MNEGLPLLCVRVNQARQLTQSLRGHGPAPDVVGEIMSRLKECARLYLPSVVLACRRCNNERGAPEAKAFDVCPVIGAERRRLTA